MDRLEPENPGGLSFEQAYLDVIVEMAKKMQIQPVRRGNLPYIIIGGFIGILVVGLAILNPPWWRFVELVAPLVLGELLVRVAFFIDERQKIHLETRYDRDWTKVFSRIFRPILEILILFGSLLFTIFMLFTGTDLSTTLIIVLARLVIFLLKIDKNPFIVFRCIGGKHSGLFYGISMAYSFFHGYLDIILPHGERPGDKGFQERVDEYVDSNRSENSTREIEIPDKRLYILIPSSGEATPSVAHNTDGWIVEKNKLPSVLRNRGGIGERTYHNTMYRIKDPNREGVRPQYVVTEFATPLITYVEACNHSTSDESWRTFKKDTVISFYETLQDILKHNKNCKNEVELIYYEDRDELDRSVNVAKVLLERMAAEAARSIEEL